VSGEERCVQPHPKRPGEKCGFRLRAVRHARHLRFYEPGRAGRRR
jgi:hypothetical protein